MSGFLVLETGEIYSGIWSGGTDRAGEVVFNTSHSGYEEIATDPSYLGQIVVMTAPMMGNYGVDPRVWESKQIWIEGFVALQIQNSTRDHSWRDLLSQNKVALLAEVDTRRLVQRLRSGGTPLGALVAAENGAEAKQKSMALIQAFRERTEKDWVWLASRKNVEVQKGERPNGPRVAVLDFGAKENILRELRLRCRELHLFSSRTSVAEILAVRPDGLMLTNGPGDPEQVQVATGTVRELLGTMPIFGICMGHQILGLALGGNTYKLPFGHRGSNHPIRDEILKQVYMTSQNHGYAVEGSSLPSDVTVTQVNLNDQTCAGFFSKTRNCLGIQYHPESHPGPHEASGLFDFFVNEMLGEKNT